MQDLQDDISEPPSISSYPGSAGDSPLIPLEDASGISHINFDDDDMNRLSSMEGGGN